MYADILVSVRHDNALCRQGSCMEIKINGNDRTAEIGRQLTEASARRSAGKYEELAACENPVLGLAGSARKGTLPDDHMKLLRARLEVDSSLFAVPSAGSGLLAGLKRWLRGFLWTLLSYQHNWFAFRQNAVNTQLYYLMEFERAEYLRKINDLEQRLRMLENKDEK